MNRRITIILLIAVSIAVVATTENFKFISFILKQTLSGQSAQVVGVSASIPQNRFNLLAQQFQEKENELYLREQALIDQEKRAIPEIKILGIKDQTFFMALLIILMLIFFLVIINFYYDWKRGRDSIA